MYAARDFRPLWMTAYGQPGPAVELLLSRVESAQLDGISSKALRKLKTSGVRRDLRRAADRCRPDPTVCCGPDPTV